MFFVAGNGLVLALPEAVIRVSDYARLLGMRYKKKLELLEKKRTVIDLRTMRPKEKQACVDAERRDYETKQNIGEPRDLTEAWIKDGFRNESYQDFIARCKRKFALEKERDNEPEPTVEHPLVQESTDKVES